MNQKISVSAIRLKITGGCNRSCSFCHEEGDMQSIFQVQPDQELFDCLHTVADRLGTHSVMITGGEPTTHPELARIIGGIKFPLISVTTNGIRFIDLAGWKSLRESGLGKVVLSVHDSLPQDFVALEKRRRNLSWAVRSLDAQKLNIANACQAGLEVRINVVAYHSAEKVLDVVDYLKDLQQQHGFNIRILNNLDDAVKSQVFIRTVCDRLGAVEVSSYRRAGTSNVTKSFSTTSLVSFSTKVSFPFFFDYVCRDCPLRPCPEGFYGVRIERRKEGYFVRLCIYRHSPDVLMHWKTFLESDLFKKMCEMLADEPS